MKSDQLYIAHILESAAKIAEYARCGEEEFLQSGIAADAILRNLQTLAESTKRLSDEFKAARPELPWREIAGIRNILVHDYLKISMEKIWELASEAVPELAQRLTEGTQEK